MQKQKKTGGQRVPRFIRTAVLTAGIMFSACAGPQQMETSQPQSAQEKPQDTHECITLREAMRTRVGACKNSGDFSACVFGNRMLFATKYEGTEELEAESELKQDILLDMGISLMSNGTTRELIIREIRQDGVLLEARYGVQDQPTVPRGNRRLISIGGTRKLESLERVKSGQFFYHFDGRDESTFNSIIHGMEVEIMSVERTASGIRVRLVADIYERCLEE